LFNHLEKKRKCCHPKNLMLSV